MGQGTLRIQARTAQDALPLRGVRIRISDRNGRVLHNLTTDEGGETAQILLEAVDRRLSLDPNYTGTPYSTYDLVAELEGFNSLHIEDVQIFDGEDSIQPVVLTPMLHDQVEPDMQEIVIGPHAIEMAGPRSQVGPLIEPRVMRQVIIPNPITVHLGRPTAYAANVQVPFTDYIKNVASNEIYPTWPRASLEANIHAIITFALNRVFTQWYRSQGYAFDITNNTAYDQYYVPGATIYQSISTIVDQIFNQYVRRAGQIAPFFTSFCSGTTATCAGMSQWGTVTLANQGRNALQILRYYYPNDIEISETNAITGIVIAYPGTTLRQGSRGLAVQTMQTFLNRIRRNYPAIPQITDDPGVFGAATDAAVRKFQSLFNLTADGVIGKATWNKISFIYNAVARLAELDSEGTALGVGTVPPDSILRVGSSGVDVLTLQYLLTMISEFRASVPAVVPQDGIFGSRTAQSVIAFQQMMGLNADGIVGPMTWNALYDVYLGIRDNVPLPPPGGGTIEYIVRAGDTLWLLAQRFGTTVAEIKALNNLTSDMLSIGQVLRIPSPGGGGGGGGSSFAYTVRAGDTLWLLAQRFGTTVEAIMQLNGLTSDALSIGQVLQIPGTVSTYTVQAGDSLWLIAQRFGTTVERLRTLNNLTGDTIFVGQTLKVA